MRPRASFSPTDSVSVTARTLDLRTFSASPADISCPPKAKQSSLSCAMEQRFDATTFQDEPGDAVDIVNVELGQRTTRQPLVACDRDDVRLVGLHQRLADG